MPQLSPDVIRRMDLLTGEVTTLVDSPVVEPWGMDTLNLALYRILRKIKPPRLVSWDNTL